MALALEFDVRVTDVLVGRELLTGCLVHVVIVQRELILSGVADWYRLIIGFAFFHAVFTLLSNRGSRHNCLKTARVPTTVVAVHYSRLMSVLVQAFR